MMTDTVQKKNEKPRLKIGFGIGLGEYGAATAAGIISGIAGAVKTIRDRFHDDVKNSSIMKDRSKVHSESLDKFTARFHKDYRTRDEAAGESILDYNRAKKADLLQAVMPKKEAFQAGKAELIRDHWMVRDGFIQGTYDMARLMPEKSGSVKKIVLNSIIGIGVGAAMTLSFFNSIATRAKIDAIDNAVEPEADQPPDMKAKLYKDRGALATDKPHPSKSKYADVLGEAKTTAAKEEHPKASASYVDKLAAESTDKKELAAVATR